MVHSEHNLSDFSVEDIPVDQERFSLVTIVAVAPNISCCVNQLPKMRLAVFDSSEANQVCPLWHRDDV